MFGPWLLWLTVAAKLQEPTNAIEAKEATTTLPLDFLTLDPRVHNPINPERTNRGVYQV